MGQPLMSTDPDLQQFAQALIRQVRDRAIDACDHLASGTSSSRRAVQWQSVLQTSDSRAALTALIPDIVDQVLFELLDRADNDLLPLAWRRNSGDYVPLSDLGHGEMAGWLMMGEGGWLQSFSEKRFNDYIAGLRLQENDDSGEP
jgi:hypothetical protein